MASEENEVTEQYIPLYWENQIVIGKARTHGGMIEFTVEHPEFLEKLQGTLMSFSINVKRSYNKRRKLMSDTPDEFETVPGTPQEPIWPEATPLPEGIEAQQIVHDVLLSQEEIENRFGFHKAAIEGPEATTEIHKDLRFAFMQFADYLNNRLGKSRTAALAQTALEEASMWSHKAIAATDPINPEV